MLLYASIESHCIVQLTNTKTADSGQQIELGFDVVYLPANEQTKLTSSLTSKQATLTKCLKFLHLKHSYVAVHLCLLSCNAGSSQRLTRYC